MRLQLINRLKASGIHLSISGTLFLLVTAIIYFSWYPNIHFTISGGEQGILLMLIIDVVLGPLITFLVFNYKKPIREKRNDLLMIACVQFFAMCYGIYNVYSTRPAAVVFLKNGMASTISYLDVESYKHIDLKTNPHNFSPLYLYASVINTETEFSDPLTKLSDIRIGSEEQFKLLSESQKKVWKEYQAKYPNAVFVNIYGLSSKKIIAIMDDKLNIIDSFDDIVSSDE